MNWKMMGVAMGVGLLIGCSESKDETATGHDEQPARQAEAQEQTMDDSSPYALTPTMNRIDGSPQPLADYQGQVVLMVNVASQCGLTPQYAGLESLYRTHQADGFVVLGFPANNFGGQEPGSNEEIQAFCTGNYDVTFPMFEKISVAGDDKHELYQTLSTVGGEPNWNFTKYLVDRQGRVVQRFGPRTAPDDPALVAAIDELISEG